jgi:galactokinase
MTTDRLAWRVDQVRRAFRAQFGGEPAVMIRAPGRVNLIGEHTDYNDGFVLPVAIDRSALVAADLRADRRVQIHALDLDAETTFRLHDVSPTSQVSRHGDWSDYPRGVAWALQVRGLTLAGMNAVFTSDVPIGAGLSSSAAVEVVFAYAWQQLSNFTLERVDLAMTCQQAENEFVGVSCGIMDQFISALGQAGHALLIDCRSLAHELVPMPDGIAIVICDSMKRRGLVDSAYNERRQQCQTGVRLLQRHLPDVAALRDVTTDDLTQFGDGLPDLVHRRVRHVVHENVRVIAFANILHQGSLLSTPHLSDDDLAAAGALMNASHVSLRDDYEVSGAELDTLVEAAWAAPGVYGSRMTGAGFGGCTVSLVASDAVEAFSQSVRDAYEAQTGLTPQIYVSRPSQGVSEL